MTTSLTSLRQKVSENLKDLMTGTFTTSSASAPADTNLAEFETNAFENWYLVPTASAQAGTVRKISTSSTAGVLTPYTAFTSATGTVGYELHKYDPVEIRRRINQAVVELYPNLWVPHIDEWSLITGNIIPNAAFQDWASSSVPDKWNVGGLITATKQTTAGNHLIRTGTNSMKLVSSAGDSYISCDLFTNRYLRDLYGRTVTLKVMCDTVAASCLKAGLYDGSAIQYSSYHAGDGKWHLLTKAVSMLADPATVTEPTFRIEHDVTDATSYISSARIIGPNVQRYLLPTSFKEVRQVFWQTSGIISFSDDSGLAMCDATGADVGWQELARYSDWDIEDDGTDKWLIMKCDLPTERRLKLVGNKYASSLSSETDTVEFNEPQTNLVAAKATALLLRAKIHDTASKNYTRDTTLLDYWERETERLKHRHSVPRPSRMAW